MSYNQFGNQWTGLGMTFGYYTVVGNFNEFIDHIHLADLPSVPDALPAKERAGYRLLQPYLSMTQLR